MWREWHARLKRTHRCTGRALVGMPLYRPAGASCSTGCGCKGYATRLAQKSPSCNNSHCWLRKTMWASHPTCDAMLVLHFARAGRPVAGAGVAPRWKTRRGRGVACDFSIRSACHFFLLPRLQWLHGCRHRERQHPWRTIIFVFYTAPSPCHPQCLCLCHPW